MPLETKPASAFLALAATQSLLSDDNRTPPSLLSFVLDAVVAFGRLLVGELPSTSPLDFALAMASVMLALSLNGAITADPAPSLHTRLVVDLSFRAVALWAKRRPVWI
jgi:hypothetical protein